MLGLSKSRFYAMMKAGVFPKPIRTAACKRPVFDADLQQKCLEIRQTGIGHNGQPVLFNRKRQKSTSRKFRQDHPPISKEHAELVEAMKSLGLTVKPEEVQTAYKICIRTVEVESTTAKSCGSCFSTYGESGSGPISHNTQITKLNGHLCHQEPTNMTENAPSCVSQNGKAKLQIVAEVAKIVRKYGLDYEGWRYISKRVRQKCDLRPAKKGRKLPRILTADDFRRFYEAVDRADDVQHSLLLRLLFLRGFGLANCAASRSATWTWRTARFS